MQEGVGVACGGAWGCGGVGACVGTMLRARMLFCPSTVLYLALPPKCVRSVPLSVFIFILQIKPLVKKCDC